MTDMRGVLYKQILCEVSFNRGVIYAQIKIIISDHET